MRVYVTSNSKRKSTQNPMKCTVETMGLSDRWTLIRLHFTIECHFFLCGDDHVSVFFVACLWLSREPRSMLGVNASSHWHCDGDLFLFLSRRASRDFLFVCRSSKIANANVFFPSLFDLFSAVRSNDRPIHYFALCLCLFLSLYSAASSTHTLNVLHLFIFIYLLFQLLFSIILFSERFDRVFPNVTELCSAAGRRRYGNNMQYTQTECCCRRRCYRAQAHAPLFAYIYLHSLSTENRKEYYGEWCLLNWMFGCCLRASCVRIFVFLLLLWLVSTE